MTIKYFDIHSHLNLSPLSENKEAIVTKMKELSVATITVGTGLETSKTAVEIAEAYPETCWATVGIHPCYCSDPLHDSGEGGLRSEPGEDGSWSELEKLALNPKVVAIGETGLDYFHEDTPESRRIQEEVFRKHIDLAIKVSKPLMLHVRASKGSDDAYFDALEILKNSSAPLRANFHFFSGSKACMEAIVAAGYSISVDGPITFSKDYDEMIKAVPLESIMVETDAPFAAPAPYRGKPCEPWMVFEVAKKIAELKNRDEETVRIQLLKNSCNFFGINV